MRYKSWVFEKGKKDNGVEAGEGGRKEKGREMDKERVKIIILVKEQQK